MALVFGIIALVAFYFSATMTFKDMNIRNNGVLIKAPVVEVYTRRSMTWIDVEINGQKLAAGSVTTMNNPGLGDSIEVFYIQGEYDVVQKSMNPRRYYLFFALEFLLLLLLGVSLIIFGLIDNKTSKNKPFIKTTKYEKRKK